MPARTLCGPKAALRENSFPASTLARLIEHTKSRVDLTCPSKVYFLRALRIIRGSEASAKRLDWGLVRSPIGAIGSAHTRLKKVSSNEEVLNVFRRILVCQSPVHVFAGHYAGV